MISGNFQLPALQLVGCLPAPSHSCELAHTGTEADTARDLQDSEPETPAQPRVCIPVRKPAGSGPKRGGGLSAQPPSWKDQCAGSAAGRAPLLVPSGSPADGKRATPLGRAACFTQSRDSRLISSRKTPHRRTHDNVRAPGGCQLDTQNRPSPHPRKTRGGGRFRRFQELLI